MAYFITRITSWSDQRDSTRRIAPADHGHRHILLNPDRISDLIADPNDATHSHFKYFDNPWDRREKWSYIKCTDSVANLVAHSNTDFFSNMITLAIHKANNPNNPTVDHTMPVEAISYADRYNPDPDHHCWVVYYNAAFKRREVLCHMSIEDLRDYGESGSTSTTVTTTHHDEV
jgi:hypothetical protein